MQTCTCVYNHSTSIEAWEAATGESSEALGPHLFYGTETAETLSEVGRQGLVLHYTHESLKLHSLWTFLFMIILGVSTKQIYTLLCVNTMLLCSCMEDMSLRMAVFIVCHSVIEQKC